MNSGLSRGVFDADALLLLEALLATSPCGNQQLRSELGWAQRGRFDRVRDSLIAAGLVQRISGGRGGRLVITIASLDDIPEDIEVSVGRERSLYFALGSHVRSMVLDFHNFSHDDDDLIEIFNTSEQGRRDTGGQYTRADLTAIVRRQVEGLYDWRDVHAIEVKPYWSVGREALYEAAAQAALHRCSFSWLLLYLPDESVALQPEQREAVQQVREVDLPAIQREAAEIGLGLAISPNLASSTDPEVMAVPRRQILDPDQLTFLLRSTAERSLED